MNLPFLLGKSNKKVLKSTAKIETKNLGSINFGVGGNQRLFYLEHKKET